MSISQSVQRFVELSKNLALQRTRTIYIGCSTLATGDLILKLEVNPFARFEQLEKLIFKRKQSRLPENHIASGVPKQKPSKIDSIILLALCRHEANECLSRFLAQIDTKSAYYQTQDSLCVSLYFLCHSVSPLVVCVNSLHIISTDTCLHHCQ